MQIDVKHALKNFVIFIICDYDVEKKNPLLRVHNF
jgi:hypothetical protein